MNKIRFSARIMCITLMLFSCSTKSDSSPLVIRNVSSEKYSSFKQVNSVNEILVLPVFKRSSIPYRSKGAHLALPDDDLSNLLTRILEIYSSRSISVLPTGSDELNDDLHVHIPSVGISQESLFKLAKKSLNKTGADSVLFSLVDMSDERTGSKIGSERSSSLRYRMWLYDGKAEAVVWSSAYKNEGGTLSDNLFSFWNRANEGFRFKSNNDLIAAAFRGSVIRLEEELNTLK
jgi:hypothetical protein